MNISYFNRDLSWLSFNYRVLEEAYDDKLPLYERIKFLAIFSNNLEEFYRVRVSYYRSLIRNLPENDPKILAVKPREVIHSINQVVSKHQAEFNALFYTQIIPNLRKEGIILVDSHVNLTNEQETFINKTFKHEILTSIQPVLLVKRKVKPFLKTGHVYLAIMLLTKSKSLRSIQKRRLPKYGLIKLPTDHGISRFIELPGATEGKHYIMFLEDMIMRHVNELFPGYFIHSWYSLKITRDADLEYEDYDGEDLIELIENIETTRAVGSPNRFQYDGNMPENMLNFLIETFNIDRNNLVKGGKTHNFRDFFTFPNPISPHLEHDKFIPLKVKRLEETESIFEVIEKRDIVLHFPYQSFDYFIRFLEQAAVDEDVLEIKTTQYRVARNSAVVDALIKAALNGKRVTVFVELKARFDEETNLEYAREMKKAGIKIIYSIPGLKVHSKIALILRNTKNGSKNLAFMGTGNFNEKTARLYCDHGYFTSDDTYINDLDKLFKYFENQNIKNNYRRILVPNHNMIETYKDLIQQEIKNVKKGGKGYILVKMNGLEDPVMIDMLYSASMKGVKIDCIIRGVCCLIPGKAYSRNIRVIRIVDRFLEHARVVLFYNNGKNILYMGSADWMKRNLYRRIECMFPIQKKSLKQEIIDIYNIQLADNVNARVLDDKLENRRIEQKGKKIRSQEEIYEYLKNKIGD